MLVRTGMGTEEGCITEQEIFWLTLRGDARVVCVLFAARIIPGAALGVEDRGGRLRGVEVGAGRSGQADMKAVREERRKLEEQKRMQAGGKSRRDGNTAATPTRATAVAQEQQRNANMKTRSSPRKAGVKATKVSRSPDVVTIDDSSGDEEEEEEEEGVGVAEGVGEGEEVGVGVGGEDRRKGVGLDWREEGTGGGDKHGRQDGRLSAEAAEAGDGAGDGGATANKNNNLLDDDEPARDAPQSGKDVRFGSIPDMAAEAVMIGTWVVVGQCHVKIPMSGRISIRLKGGGDAKDTTLDIPADEAILDAVSGGKDMTVKGELPRILRRALDTRLEEEKREAEEEEKEMAKGKGGEGAKREDEVERVRTRRTLRSHTVREETSQVVFHYPPEASASDRVAINSLDEARTQEGEFLNDSLVDLYLKHMHREAYKTWDKGGRCSDGGAMDAEKVHVFSSHFFTKLTEGRLTNFDAAYSKVQYWTRNVDLFSKKFVFVPVVENMHWSLACIANLDKLKVGKAADNYGPDEEQPCILFLDSLSMHHASRIWNYLSRYLEKKWNEEKREDKGDAAFDWSDLPLVRPRAPSQINGCDCGVYVLRYAKEICQQWPAVTSSQVEDRLKTCFKPQLFSPSDISDERLKLRDLLGECK
eukprot:jgi/Undpi1/1886/HiC_scaffold_12.g05273.m1